MCFGCQCIECMRWYPPTSICSVPFLPWQNWHRLQTMLKPNCDQGTGRTDEIIRIIKKRVANKQPSPSNILWLPLSARMLWFFFFFCRHLLSLCVGFFLSDLDIITSFHLKKYVVDKCNGKQNCVVISHIAGMAETERDTDTALEAISIF